MAKYTFLKSSKIEDYVKMLVYPIIALKFDTGGLDLPPAGECQGSLEKRQLLQELMKRNTI